MSSDVQHGKKRKEHHFQRIKLHETTTEEDITGLDSNERLALKSKLS